MKKNSSTKILIIFLVASCFSISTFASESRFVEWDSPVPRFSELKLNVNDVSHIAGDGLFLLILNEKNINLWTKGRLKTYPNARITMAATVMDAPVAQIKEKVLDIVSMPKYMPQISNASVIEQSDKNRFMVEWVQTYTIPFLELKAKFVIQHDLEKSGDISGLLLEGDIDAGAFRWEFIPISENKTLVVYSYWGDQKSAGLAFKIFMNAQPEFELSMGAITSSMVLTQLKSEIEKNHLQKTKASTGQLAETAVIPLIKNGRLPFETLERLSKQGRLVLVTPKIKIKAGNKPIDIRFVSAISLLPEKPNQLIPFATNYPLMSDYLRYYKSLTVEKGVEQDLVDAKMKINIGPVFIRVNSQFFTQWNESKDVQTFRAKPESDLYPLIGAMEFIPIKNGESTLMVYTMALDISDSAGWILQQGKKLQEYAMIMSLHQVVTLLDKQADWINKKSAKSIDKNPSAIN